MGNIQDLKEKFFFESKNIIDILEKINNVDELLSKQDLVDELAGRISFLRLLEKNVEYFITDNNPNQMSGNQFFVGNDSDTQISGKDVTEEEAIFNNQLNEIDENEIYEDNYSEKSTTENDITEEERVFNDQLKEIEENESSEYHGDILSFVDEERILADSEPDSDDDIHEGMFNEEITEEETVFNNQLNEIDNSEKETSNVGISFKEEEKIEFIFDPETINEKNVVEGIPNIFDSEILEEEILIEENEDQFITSNTLIEQGEMITETSNVENILNEIKNENQNTEEEIIPEDDNRRKIDDIEKPVQETEKQKPYSDESFETDEDCHQEKKIKLAHIKGLKVVETLFDDDPLEREIVTEPEPIKESSGSILKTNVPTDYMEAEKPKPEFRLDLNDRIAFSKTLFGGSQSELNEVVSELNKFRTLDEAKEYLSDLYYEKNWKKVDEYAQRLWVLVENKFL